MNLILIMVKMIIDRWEANIINFNAVLNSITNEQLQKEVSPGKNRGIYLLGHLIAVHDKMLRLLDFEDSQDPELHKMFIDAPDKSISEITSANDLRLLWSRQSEMLTQKISRMRPEEWFEKHTSVSSEDFIKSPHRNKLNILLTRTTHLSYHTGQMVLIK
jgi:hypothetical protein